MEEVGEDGREGDGVEKEDPTPPPPFFEGGEEGREGDGVEKENPTPPPPSFEEEMQQMLTRHAEEVCVCERECER